ncbi:hypothetical protein [Roseomonas indoligenes]|uniref:Uncharacterized protein n=1 Tax=Roseomonas indoligenes TaxID=2820811 RepID=A0A940MV06_9PROT|nr:hypothetical protein [Pararoseomonas indoligenes]MBP0492218.1 hypothetical protein [Pararoseomonas indoligenes]
MALVIRRQSDESWRAAVERIAGKYGLAAECLEVFDDEIEDGADEGRAAWNALYEWDCLAYVPDPEDEE